MDKIHNPAQSRLLTTAEQVAVTLTMQPTEANLSRQELKTLVRRLREARDRANTTANQQRREMRGKSEPRGAAPARDDTGTIAKEELLPDALKRVMEQLKQVEGTPDWLASSQARQWSNERQHLASIQNFRWLAAEGSHLPPHADETHTIFAPTNSR